MIKAEGFEAPDNTPEPEDGDSTTDDPETNLGLVLGLSIPLGILCMIAVFVLMKKNSA